MFKSSIGDPISLLIFILIVLSIFILLFRFQNWFDSKPVKEKKKEEKKVESKVKVEIKNESEKSVSAQSVSKDKTSASAQSSNASTSSNSSASCNGDCGYGCNTCAYYRPNNSGYSSDNYLYDRFVVSPTKEDYVTDSKISDAFLSGDELKSIRDRNHKIQVGKNNSDEVLSKNELYNKIQQMANKNTETKERMLKEFEELPNEIKLMLIGSIIEKM